MFWSIVSHFNQSETDSQATGWLLAGSWAIRALIQAKLLGINRIDFINGARCTKSGASEGLFRVENESPEIARGRRGVEGGGG